MSCAVLIHGQIGSGKTLTCLSLVERLRLEGITFGGLVSIRSYQDKELAGYDGVDVSSGETMPLVRLRCKIPDMDWFGFGDLKYVFSVQGFEWANGVLIRTVESESCPRIVFVDEFGRLEKAGLGFYPSVLKVLEKLGVGRIIVFTCREDILDVLEELLEGRADTVYKFNPRELDPLWGVIQKWLASSLK
ncbi:MAG: nucleoside-triphosphatase [Candidatus Bathyarchaeia archaeon]